VNPAGLLDTSDLNIEEIAAQYNIDVMVGSSYFEVQLDTGSQAFAILGISVSLGGDTCPFYTGPCNSNGLPGFETYATTDRFEFEVCSKESNSIQLGPAKGEVPFGKITAQYKFIVADATTGTCRAQGVAGAGLPTSSAEDPGLAALNKEPLIWSLLAQSKIPAVIGTQFCKFGDESTGGHLTLGSANPDLFAGAFQELSVQPNSAGFWAVELTSITINGHQFTGGDLQGSSTDFQTIVDTGNDAGFGFVPVVFGTFKNQAISGLDRVVADFPSSGQLCLTAQTIARYMPSVTIKAQGGATFDFFGASFLSAQMFSELSKNCFKPSSTITNHGEYFSLATGAGMFDFFHSISFIQATQLDLNNNLGQAFVETFYTVFDKLNNVIKLAPSVGCPDAP